MSGGSWDRLGPKRLERLPWHHSQGPDVCSICRDEGFVSESVHSVFKSCTFQHQRGAWHIIKHSSSAGVLDEPLDKGCVPSTAQ